MKNKNFLISNSFEPGGSFWVIKTQEGELQAPFSTGRKERSSTTYISESMKEFIAKYKKYANSG